MYNSIMTLASYPGVYVHEERQTSGSDSKNHSRTQPPPKSWLAVKKNGRNEEFDRKMSAKIDFGQNHLHSHCPQNAERRTQNAERRAQSAEKQVIKLGAYT